MSSLMQMLTQLSSSIEIDLHDDNDMFAGYSLQLHSAIVNNVDLSTTLMTPADWASINDRVHSATHTPLSLALILGRNVDMIQCLIAHGADVNADLGQCSIVHIAASHCVDSRAIDALIDAGADLSRLDGDENSVCHFAALNPNANVIARLIEANCPSDLPNQMRQRPIHIAVMNENDEVLRKLIAARCVVEDEDRPNMCHLAARNRNERVLTALIDAGAAVDLPNIDNDLPIHWAAAHNENDLVIGALIAANVKLNEIGAYPFCRTPAFLACSNPNPNVLERLLAAGAELTNMEIDGSTPCHEAAKNRETAVMRRLVERGLDVNARNQDQDHAAARGGVRGHR
jgi:ankyrin repeat protein